MEGDGAVQHQYGAVETPRELEANPLLPSEDNVASNPPAGSSSNASAWRRAGLLGLAGAAAFFAATSGSIPGWHSNAAGAGMDLAAGGSRDVTIEVFQSEDHPLIYKATVCMDAADASDSLALAWHPVGSQLGWVKQDVNLSSVTGCAATSMHRMRAASEYEVHLVDASSESARKIKGISLTTESTSYSFFNEVFGQMNGTTLPTWELISTTGSYQLDNVTEAAFRGVFTLDSEGWVVWFYDSQAYTYVFDWATDSSSGAKNMVLLHSHNSDYEYPGMLMEIKLSGHVVQSYEHKDCTNEHGYGIFDHEARYYVKDNGVAHVLSTERISQNYSTSPDFNYSRYDRTVFGGAKIVDWDLSTNTIKYPYNLFNFLDPFLNAYYEGADFGTYDEYCNAGNESVTAVDWMHMNSVSISDYDGSYIVSIHALDTIISLYADGSGVQWILSSSMKHLSTLEWKDDRGYFKEQHDVQQLSNGHLVMMDNSWNTKGCTSCSRALEIAIDFDEMVAWQTWDYPHGTDAMLGGSVTAPANLLGPYVVAFCKLKVSDSDNSGMKKDHNPTHVYEIYKNGTSRSLMMIPAPNEEWTSGSYRATPSSSVGDEAKLDGYAEMWWPKDE